MRKSESYLLLYNRKTDSGYYRQDYFINGGKAQMIALFEDSACKIYHGDAAFYYANGYPERKVRMNHNKPEGQELRYHNNGIMSDSGNYHNGKPVGTVFSWHNNAYIADSVAYVNDSSAVHISWFDDGTPAASGREINGKKQGTWVFFHHNGNKASTEVYEKGKRISCRHFDDGGNEIAVDSNRHEHRAEFKGWIEKWQSYLEKALAWPYGYHFENTNIVAIRVEMIIDEQGKIGNVYIINPFHPAFDKIAYDIISKSPNWIPAIQHNRTVKYRFVQTVSFQQQ